jgi:signal transduction histidine kinase
LQTGQSMLLPVVDQEDLRALLQPQDETLLERVHVYSMLVVPLRAHRERIGTLAVWCDRPGRPYTAEDLALVQELANRATLSIANAQLYQTAQAALRTRDEFMSAVSHDLGQPLTVVNGALQLLRRFLEQGMVPTSEELGEEVDMIAASTASMMAMIGELLDVARAQSGRPVELSYRPLDLVALVRQGVRMQQQNTELPQIRMKSAEATLPLEGDRDRLSRVVANLLSNAVKYSPAGGTITVSLTQEETEQRRWVVLSVQDAGMGIPAADLPSIFERFHRGSNVRGMIAGTGIGLAGAKQTVELHGGDIRVESVEGKGTSVTVRLPLD